MQNNVGIVDLIGINYFKFQTNHNDSQTLNTQKIQEYLKVYGVLKNQTNYKPCE